MVIDIVFHMLIYLLVCICWTTALNVNENTSTDHTTTAMGYSSSISLTSNVVTYFDDVTPYSVEVYPVELYKIKNNHNYGIKINCSDERFHTISPYRYKVQILSENTGIIDVMKQYKDLLLNTSVNDKIVVETLHGGRTAMLIQIQRVPEFNTSLEGDTVASVLVPVSIIRARRMVDTAFDFTVATLVVIGAFSLGCATDCTLLWFSVKQPKILIVALSCQFFVMPLVSLK